MPYGEVFTQDFEIRNKIMENKEVNKLIAELDNVVTTILKKESDFNKTFINKRSGFQHYPCITLEDLADIPRNIVHKLKYRPYEFSEKILDSMEYISERVSDSEHFLINSLNHPNNIDYLYSFMMTMIWVDKYLYQNLEWENLPEDTMPTSLRSRLAKQKRSITNLEKSSIGLDEKVQQINNAYNAAKNLPVVQDDLQEAIDKVHSSNIEMDRLHKEQVSKSDEFSKNILLTENKGKERLNEIEEYKKKIEKLYLECEELKNKSAQAYRITNTNGLAGSFKERATTLHNSSRWWIGGLIASLFALWWIGSNQVEKLQTLYATPNINTAAIILQSITALLSITAPLWFAWLSTSQIHKLFKLSEDYGFKSSVSQSYEGYRKETADISEELLKDLMTSLLKIMNDEPLRLVKDDTNATSPYSDMLRQILSKQKQETEPKNDKKENLSEPSIAKKDDKNLNEGINENNTEDD